MNLHSVPISFKVDENDLDLEKWKAFDFEYCHQVCLYLLDWSICLQNLGA